MISRRGLLLSAGAGAGAACGRSKGRRFPGYVFVANEEGRSVAAVDLRRFRRAREIAVDSSPTEVIAHPTRPLAYVLAPQSGAVYEIDGVSLAVKRHSHPAPSLIRMQLDAGGQALWLLGRDPHALIRLPLDSLHPAGRIRLPGVPEDFDLDREGRLAAITFANERAVGMADLAAGVVRHSIPVGAEPRLVRFQSDGRQLLVGNRGDRTVTIVDVATGRIVVHLPLPLEPAHFCFKPDGGELYVTGPGMDAVVIIFPYSMEVGETILAGRMPEGMAACDSPPYLFVTNPVTSDVTVLDTDTRKLVSTVRVGEEPHHVLFTPDHEYALVLNRKSGDLAVIRMVALREAAARRYKMGPLFTMIPVGAKPVSAAVVAVG